jgi:hypothetical protein
VNVQIQGASIDELLTRVADDYGPGARILAAERVRRGGVGGFFSKEHYEMTVEVPEPTGGSVPAEPAAAEPATAPRTAGSLLELADAVSEDERAGSRGFAASTPPTVSTENPGFAAVMTRLASTLAAEPGSLVPDTPAALLPDSGAAGSGVIASGAVASGAVTATLAPPQTRPAALRPQRKAAVPEQAGPHRTPARDPRRGPVRRAYTASSAEQQETPQTPAARRPSDAPAAGQRRQAALRALGLPARLLPAGRGSVLDQLTRALSAAPQAPRLPAGAGEVIVVAGPAAAALATARAVAGLLHLDDTAVHLVAHTALGSRVPASRLVTGRTAAARRRLGWATKPHPVVVALDAPMAPERLDDARRLLDVLSPTYLLCVAPATTRSADLRRWLTQLDARSQRAPLALAVTETDASTRPATVLGLRLPVALLDGQPARPATWATMLLSRLQEGSSQMSRGARRARTS